MNQNYLICNSANQQVQLNESAGEKYVLTGCFATLNEKNRNSRIYTEDEYLKHLSYLRQDIEGEGLLGELDHPEDRFEVKLKEASHKITNLWYDKDHHSIMGTIELLDTPNGRIAKSLVDQGVPLHISSRAAGSVNSDNTVDIQQIYTYDLVAKPGFASAVLHRVNESESESAFTQEAKDFLKSCEINEARNLASHFGINENSVSITPMFVEPKLRKEAVSIMNEENNNENTDMEKQHTSLQEDDAASVVTGEDTASQENADGKDSEKSDSNEESAKKDSDDDKEDDGVEILSVSAVTSDDEDDEEKNDEESNKEKSEDEEDSNASDEKSEKESSSKDDDNKTDECKTVECNQSADDDKEEKKVTDANRLNDSTKSEIKDRKDNFLKTIQGLTAAIEKKSKCEKDRKDESVLMAQYPVSMMLNESNFAKFQSLTESQKTKVANYLKSNKIIGKDEINEKWMNGLNEQEEAIWLKYAPENYRRLYEAASDTVKASLKMTADYVLFENQRDINVFWENSGLEAAESRRMLNESFIANMPKITAVQENELSYDSKSIQMIADMASEYC